MAIKNAVSATSNIRSDLDNPGSSRAASYVQS